PWRIPPDRTAHIMPEKWAEIDTLLKKWQSEEFHVLKEIDGERRQYLQWPDMSTLPRETIIKEDDPCRQDDDNYDLSTKVYIRTYACTTAAQPVRLMVSGDPILFEPIRARYQFQIISQDDGKATFKILSSAGTRDLHINLLNSEGTVLMTFGQDDIFFDYPDTFYTVSTEWIWNIGKLDFSKIGIEINTGRDSIWREIEWDWNELNICSVDKQTFDLEVILSDSACQVVADTIQDFLTIEKEAVTVEEHDVYVIVHCVFDEDNPLSSYLELRTQDLARILVDNIDNRDMKIISVDASGHTCIVGSPERNQRLSILRAIRTERNFRNYIKLMKNFWPDEEDTKLGRWLECDPTVSGYGVFFSYGLRGLGKAPTRDTTEVWEWNNTPEERVKNRRAEIEIVKIIK
ncbi:MAG: hypothetical protein JSV84_02950, partial [Gemmatimonadota bacterium]